MDGVNQALGHQRVECRENKDYHGKWFIPHRFFDKYFTRDVVSHRLTPLEPATWEQRYGLPDADAGENFIEDI